MYRRLIIWALLVCLIAAGCTTAAQPPSATSPTTKTPTTAIPDVDAGPKTSWDHPFMSEGTTTDSTALLKAPGTFGLTFAPRAPGFSSGKARWVDVSQGGTVAFAYDFSGDPRFAGDGRVLVEESPATMTEAEFIGVKWSGTYSLTRVGPITIVLQEYDGIGDARFITGGVMYEILGAALSPAAALDLATQLANQVR